MSQDAFVAAVQAQGVPEFEAQAAVAAVRSYCGWHVIPPRTNPTVRGPGGHLGYTAEEAADVVLVARSLGRGASTASGGVDREQVGSASVEWAAEAASGALTGHHRAILDPYKTPPFA